MAKEVRVVQNKEPKHFLSIFKKNFIVHLGKEKDPRPSVALYEVSSSNSWNLHAIQVRCSCESLNSNRVYLLTDWNANWIIWKGKCSLKDELEYAQQNVLANGHQ